MILDNILSVSYSCFSSCPISSTIIFLLLAVIISYYVIKPNNLPPGPWGIPWVGCPHLLTDNVHHDMDNLAKEYGDIYTLMMGTRPLIVLNSNRLIHECLVKRGEEFSSRPVMYDLDHMNLMDELFNIGYSQKWKEHKVIMVRILRAAGFGSSKVEERFIKYMDIMYANLEKEIAVSTKKPLQKLLAMTLADVVYGAKYNYNDEELETLMTLAIEWMESVYKEGMGIGYWSDNVPAWITKRLQPAMMKAMKDTTFNFQEFLIKKIHEHRKTVDKTNPKDVLDGYLTERGDDPELTDLALSSTVLMLFPDGIDSTGALLNFVIFYLAYYPEWQTKVQQQIDEVVGDRRVSLSDREKLSMVEASIYEAGRIGSVVCLTIAHSPIKNTTLEGYNIPMDSYILGNIWAAHMEKDLFPQGENFAPETLLDAKGKFVRNDKIMMFSAGHRMCIGAQMVKNMAFLYVSNTLQKYKISFPAGEPLPKTGSVGGLIREPHPFKVCFTPRSEE